MDGNQQIDERLSVLDKKITAIEKSIASLTRFIEYNLPTR